MTRAISWTRALLLEAFSEPRVARYAPAALLATLVLRASLAPLGDPDAPWIAAAGREFLARGTVPRTNLWSAVDPAHPWVFHEWLLSPIYALLLTHVGPRGLALLGVLAGCATAASLLVALRAARVRADTSAWVLFVALLALQASVVSPRPGYALLSLPLLLLALTRSPAWTLRHLLAALALTLLWTNAHGSFPLALLLLGASALRAGPSDRRARVATLVLAALVTFANPYGAGLHALVWRYLRGGDPMAALLRAEIVEFRPLWTWPEPFANGWVVLACVGVVVLALRALWAGTRAHRVDALLALGLVAMGVMQSRHLALAALLGGALLGGVLDALRATSSLAWKVLRPSAIVTPAVVLGVSLLALRDPGLAPTLGGSGLASLARGVGPRRAWVPFDASGWFVWNARASGDARVLFDARNDCHPAEAARDALALERGALRGNALCVALTTRGIGVVVAPGDHPAMAVLGCEGWRLEARAGTWARAALSASGRPGRSRD